MNIVLCDMDHTVSDSRPRDYLLETFPNVDWDAYHGKLIEDKPVIPIVNLINSLHMTGFVVVGLTARPEKWRSLTMKWLVQYGVMMDDIIMRPDDGFEPAVTLKYNMAIEHFGSEDAIRENVALLLDDRSDITDRFKQMGITTLQVKMGDKHEED